MMTATAVLLFIAGSSEPISSEPISSEPILGGDSCLQGERCWGGTYKYCDNISSGDKCACYNCN
jgi:hypothetical protein